MNTAQAQYITALQKEMAEGIKLLDDARQRLRDAAAARVAAQKQYDVLRSALTKRNEGARILTEQHAAIAATMAKQAKIIAEQATTIAEYAAIAEQRAQLQKQTVAVCVGTTQAATVAPIPLVTPAALQDQPAAACSVPTQNGPKVAVLHVTQPPPNFKKAAGCSIMTADSNRGPEKRSRAIEGDDSTASAGSDMPAAKRQATESRGLEPPQPKPEPIRSRAKRGDWAFHPPDRTHLNGSRDANGVPTCTKCRAVFLTAELLKEHVVTTNCDNTDGHETFCCGTSKNCSFKGIRADLDLHALYDHEIRTVFQCDDLMCVAKAAKAAKKHKKANLQDRLPANCFLGIGNLLHHRTKAHPPEEDSAGEPILVMVPDDEQPSDDHMNMGVWVRGDRA